MITSALQLLVVSVSFLLLFNAVVVTVIIALTIHHPGSAKHFAQHARKHYQQELPDYINTLRNEARVSFCIAVLLIVLKIFMQ